MTNQVTPDSELSVEDGKVYLNGHVVAIVTGPAITADQLSASNKAATEKERLMASLNKKKFDAHTAKPDNWV